MNPKLLIIKLLLNPDIHSRYREYISEKGDKHLETIYKVLDESITRLNRVMTLDELKSILWASNATERDKDREVYEQYFKVLTEAEIGEDVLHEILLKVKQSSLAEKLGVQALDFALGKGKIEHLQALSNELFDLKSDVPEDDFVTTDLEELYNETVATPGLRWRLGSLNRMLGSLRKGDFGFVFARPETGKTTFIASEVTYFASQATAPILWLNNEEQGNKVMIRCYQAATGKTLDELMGDRNAAKEEYFRLTRGNIRIFDDAAIYKRQIEDLCSRYKPAMVVIDQLDKIKGFDGDREDLKLGAVYQWARELAKQHCPVIAVSQANGTGEGVKWLNMSHVANAKTSKQAEADFIIGLGKTNDTALEYTRHLNISKNKLHGDPDSDPTRRHGRCDIIIEPTIARYHDV